MSTDGTRLVFGFAILSLVVVLRVLCPKLTNLALVEENIPGQLKPFQSTYFKACSLMIYLVGIVISKRWSDFCFNRLRGLRPNCKRQHGPARNVHSYTALRQNEELTEIDEKQKQHDWEDLEESILSESSWIPISINNCSENPSEYSGNDSEKEDLRLTKKKAKVRFSKLTEVRHLCKSQADEAVFARLSFSTSQRIEAEVAREASRLSPGSVLKLAVKFTFLWFFATLAYEIALQRLDYGTTQFIYCSSSFFVILLSYLFPSNSQFDSMSLTKVLALSVAYFSVFSLTGGQEPNDFNARFGKPEGIYALISALLSAASIVILRFYVSHEDHLDVPIFLGLVGVLSCLFMWPGFLILHYTKFEPFEMFNWSQLTILLVNGIFGTAITEILWLWGCLLTSSLLTAMSTYLMIPLTDLVNLIAASSALPPLFLALSLSLILSVCLVIVASLCDYDLLLSGAQKLVSCCCNGNKRPAQNYVMENEILLESENA